MMTVNEYEKSVAHEKYQMEIHSLPLEDRAKAQEMYDEFCKLAGEAKNVFVSVSPTGEGGRCWLGFHFYSQNVGTWNRAGGVGYTNHREWRIVGVSPATAAIAAKEAHKTGLSYALVEGRIEEV